MHEQERYDLILGSLIQCYIYLANATVNPLWQSRRHSKEDHAKTTALGRSSKFVAKLSHGECVQARNKAFVLVSTCETVRAYLVVHSSHEKIDIPPVISCVVHDFPPSMRPSYASPDERRANVCSNAPWP